MRFDKKKNIFLGILMIILVSVLLDNFLVKQISFLRNPLLDSFFLFINIISSKVILFSFLTAILLWEKHKRRWIFPLWLTLIGSAIVGFFLKILIHRQRPFQEGIVSLVSILQTESHNLWDFSFPSGHSLLAFCAIPILSQTFPRFKKFWIIFASLIAFSRVYLGFHFFSDVISGALIGYLIGIFIVKKEKDKEFGKKIYNKFKKLIKH